MRRMQPDPTVPGLAPDRVAVIAAIAKLPDGQREVIALHYFADMRIEDIAGCLRAPVGTVKSRLSRGREALAVLLGDPDDHLVTSAKGEK